MHIRGPVSRMSRAFGRKVDNKSYDKDPLHLRGPLPPGQRRRQRKKSDYAKHLMEVQIARYIYGIFEKQFRRYFREAKRRKGITGDELLKILESRLDNVVYRSAFTYSRKQAKQLVVHRHFMVNGRCVDKPSYQVKPGDVISVKSSKANKTYFKDIKDNKTSVTAESYWLNSDIDKLEAHIKRFPSNSEITPIFDAHMIVEYYSKYV